MLYRSETGSTRVGIVTVLGGNDIENIFHKNEIYY
jgi:hypothetical protein